MTDSFDGATTDSGRNLQPICFDLGLEQCCCLPQRAAAVAGLAYQDPVSHLCLHPKYGAWLSLRCLLVFDGIQYTGMPLFECDAAADSTHAVS